MPCRSYPLGRHADELEHEGFDAAGLLQSEGFRVQPAHEELVEVAYDCREQQEHSVLCHERLWQPGSSESVIHIVEDAFLAAPEVVELNDFPRGGHIVVGQDAAVCVFSLPQVQGTVHPTLPLYDESVRLAFPLLHDDGIQLILDAVDLLALPSTQCQQTVVEGGAAANAALTGAVSNVLQGGMNYAFLGVPYDFNVKDFLLQTAISGVIGGVTGGIQAKQSGANFWTGKSATSSLSSQIHAEKAPTNLTRYEESNVLSPHKIGEIGELQAAADFRAEGGEVIGRHFAYRVEGVDGYGFTDVVGKKDKKLHIIEAKNGNKPKFTEFQKKAFPKIMNGAKIEFFGPNAKQMGLPIHVPLNKYSFEIRRYHQYVYP